MDLRQILMTKPILYAIRQINPLAETSHYKHQKGEQGFALTRLSDIEKRTDPIVIKPVLGAGIRFDEKMHQLYEIIDGRHRIAHAASLGKRTIPAIIQ